jgi:hypothetical protein
MDAPTPRDGEDPPAEDVALLASLRAVAAAVDPVPVDAVLAARSALAYLRLDAELAVLGFDSHQDQLAGLRAEQAAVRQLSFQTGAVEIELEIVADGEHRQLIGQCIPAMVIEVTVRQPDGERTITTDDLGRFTTAITPGPVSLRCSWPSTDQAVETTWVRA